MSKHINNHFVYPLSNHINTFSFPYYLCFFLSQFVPVDWTKNKTNNLFFWLS